MKMTEFRPPIVEEDFEAWEVFKNTDHRWVFNKLELALRQGLSAGPAATAPEKSGAYIQRPIYNLYGMGIGAKKFLYDKDSMREEMINHSLLPPGHFWCEWINGDHLSVDYSQDYKGNWHKRSVWLGVHNDESNLTRFESWKRVGLHYGPEWHSLPVDSTFLQDPRVYGFNIELIRNKIIEIHLRLGNDPLDDLPVGTEITPVWNDEKAPEGEWRGNLHKDLELYAANGQLKDVRRGYVIKRPEEL